VDSGRNDTGAWRPCQMHSEGSCRGDTRARLRASQLGWTMVPASRPRASRWRVAIMGGPVTASGVRRHAAIARRGARGAACDGVMPVTVIRPWAYALGRRRNCRDSSRSRCLARAARRATHDIAPGTRADARHCAHFSRCMGWPRCGHASAACGAVAADAAVRTRDVRATRRVTMETCSVGGHRAARVDAP